MESFLLLNLASVTTVAEWPIAASAVTMVFANRADGSFIQPEQVRPLETLAGRGILDALVGFPLVEGVCV